MIRTESIVSDRRVSTEHNRVVRRYETESLSRETNIQGYRSTAGFESFPYDTQSAAQLLLIGYEIRINKTALPTWNRCPAGLNSSLYIIPMNKTVLSFLLFINQT